MVQHEEFVDRLAAFGNLLIQKFGIGVVDDTLQQFAESGKFLVVQAVREVLVGSGILLVPALGNLEVIRQKLRQVDELADEGAVLVEDDNGVEERLPAGAAALARLVAVDDDVGVLERRRAADLREGRPDEGEALDRAGIVADNVPCG